MRPEREHLASRLEEIARPGSAGDRERIVAYALRYGSETLTDEEALAEARERLGESQNGNNADVEDGPFALPLGDFIAAKQNAPEPLLGTEDDNILPAHGLGLVIGKGGKGKTTFVIDLCLHLASGVDFLGLNVERPLNTLLIENEGPREPFRRKVERKLESWPHEIKGLIAIHTENWGLARLDLPGVVDRLNAYCIEHEIDLVVGDPLDSLGMDGEGSPSETRAMVDRFKAGGLFTERAWLLPHHSRKESVQDAVDEAAGAWGGRPDALLTLEKKSDNQARLSFARSAGRSGSEGPTSSTSTPRRTRSRS
jgi:RecA-family ATPase